MPILRLLGLSPGEKAPERLCNLRSHAGGIYSVQSGRTPRCCLHSATTIRQPGARRLPSGNFEAQDQRPRYGPGWLTARPGLRTVWRPALSPGPRLVGSIEGANSRRRCLDSSGWSRCLIVLEVLTSLPRCNIPERNRHNTLDRLLGMERSGRFKNGRESEMLRRATTLTVLTSFLFGTSGCAAHKMVQ